jgi:hypothetical protein
MAVDGKWRWTFGSLTILGLLMSLFGGIGQIILTPGNKTLQISLKKLEDERGKQSQNNETSFQSAISDELLTLSDILHFGDSERISLYYDDSRRLAMLGRYSENTEFNRRGRGFCNYEEGVLGIAWVNCDGKAFEDNFPDDSERYVQMCSNSLNMNIDTARRLRMKSRTICIRPIKNFDKHKTAALVFESMNPNAFTQEQIDEEMVQGRQAQRMQRLLKTWEGLIPNLNIASREGV